MTFFNGALEQSGRFILTWTWQAFVLLLAAWVFVRLDHQHRPVLRERVWCAALVAVLLLPLVTIGMNILPGASNIRDALPELSSFAPPVADFETPSLQEASGASSASAVDWPYVLVRLAGFVWLIGVGVTLARRLSVIRRIRRICSTARPGSLQRLAKEADWTWLNRQPNVRLSTEVRAPMAYGLVQPVILLPDDIEQWSTVEERIAMLRHECIHLRRRDHWIAAVEGLLRTLFFFHPPVIMACRSLDIERELSCDTEVLNLGSDANCYAETILNVAERVVRARVVHAGVLFASAALLDRRIEMLFRRIPSVRRHVIVIPTLAMAALLFVLGISQKPSERVIVGIGPYLSGMNLPVKSFLRFESLFVSVKPSVKRPPVSQSLSASPLKLIRDGENLSSLEVSAGETRLARNPNSLDDRLSLLGYYSRNRWESEDRRKFGQHVLWFIENHPELPVYVYASFDANHPDFAEARRLWIANVETRSDNPEILLNAASAFIVRDRDLCERILQKAEALYPADFRWSQQLGQMYLLRMYEDRQGYALKSLVASERSLALATSRGQDGLLPQLAEAAFNAGLPDKAQEYANRAIRSGKPFLIHEGHWVLGEIALERRDIESAKFHLLDSVNDAGFLAFNPGTPRMHLAAELARHGERESVLAYFEKCGTFWTAGKDRLMKWSVLVAEGLVPTDFTATIR